MENEEIISILEEDLPEEATRTESAVESADAADRTVLPCGVQETGADDAEPIPEAGDSAAAELPGESSAEEDSRLIRIPAGYESFPDGWYPKNPVRRFMERWGSFLNLGLILVMMAAVLLRPQQIVLHTTEPLPTTAPTEATETVTEPPAEAAVPTMPVFSEAVQTDCFSVADGVLSFDRSKFLPTEILQIPSELNGEPVTAIAAGAFENLDGITTVVIPDGIRTIRERAFAGCRDLRGVVLPASIGAVEAEAFCGCDHMEGIYIPGQILAIGTHAFEDCASLRYIFYSGDYEDWTELYDAYISPFTFVLCLDGEFPHAAQIPVS